MPFTSYDDKRNQADHTLGGYNNLASYFIAAKALQDYMEKNRLMGIPYNGQWITHFQIVSDGELAKKVYDSMVKAGLIRQGQHKPHFHIENHGDFLRAMQIAKQAIQNSDNYLELLPRLNDIEYEYSSGRLDEFETEHMMNSLMARIASKRKLTAEEEYQMEFDFIQEMIERLQDNLEAITYVNEDLQKATDNINKLTQQQSAYPLPDTKAAQKNDSLTPEQRSDLNQILNRNKKCSVCEPLPHTDERHKKIIEHQNGTMSWLQNQVRRKSKFTSVTNPSGRIKVRRLSAEKKLSFAKHELEEIN